MERGVRRSGCEGELVCPAAALGIELRRDGERLDERRLAASVFADEERHARVERDPLDLRERRELVRVIALLVCDTPGPDPDGMHERRARKSCHHVLIMPRYAHAVAGQIIAVVVTAFFTGALARFAVPGPDPMPCVADGADRSRGHAHRVGRDRGDRGRRSGLGRDHRFPHLDRARARLPALRAEARIVGTGGVPVPGARRRRRAVPRASAARGHRSGDDRRPDGDRARTAAGGAARRARRHAHAVRRGGRRSDREPRALPAAARRAARHGRPHRRRVQRGAHCACSSGSARRIEPWVSATSSRCSCPA